MAWVAYRRHLLNSGKSPDTVYNYRSTLQKLSRSLPPGTDLWSVTALQVACWLEAGTAEWSKASLATHSRRARTFFTWSVRGGYAETDPMTAIAAVKEGIREIDIPDPADIRAVADLISRGKDFESRRDWVIICLLAEAGTPRATELADLAVQAVDLRHEQLRFTGKGDLERTIALGAASCRALTLYLRARAGHPKAGLPQLLLGRQGRMTRHGVRQMLERRCAQAGVPRIPPHHFRHLTASEFMGQGGSVVDAMKLYGWRTPLMAARYGAAAAGQRAVRHARAMSIGDAILTGKASS
jgi:site-specific recombinase XerD